jgi:hypothetical protein
MKELKLLLKAAAFGLIAALLWCACPTTNPDNSGGNGGGETEETESGENEETQAEDYAEGSGKPETPPTVEADESVDGDGTLTLNPKETSALGLTSPAVIVFNGAEAPTLTEGADVSVSAATDTDTNRVTAALSANGANIVLQGSGANTSVTLTGNYDAALYLNGADLSSGSDGGPVINHEGTGTLTVRLVDGTENRLADSADSGGKAAFYSKGSLLFGGGGNV